MVNPLKLKIVKIEDGSLYEDSLGRVFRASVETYGSGTAQLGPLITMNHIDSKLIIVMGSFKEHLSAHNLRKLSARSKKAKALAESGKLESIKPARRRLSR